MCKSTSSGASGEAHSTSVPSPLRPMMVSASVFRSDEWYLRNMLTIRPQPQANRLRKHLVSRTVHGHHRT